MTLSYGKRRIATFPALPPPPSDWELTDPALNREIEGFCSSTDVNTGEIFQVFVNTAAPTFKLKWYRIGWYGGARASGVTTETTHTGHVQPMPVANPVTFLAECVWTNAIDVDTTGWQTGVYIGKLTASTGKQRYVICVVRNDASTVPFLFQCSVTTYAAYNKWAGYRDLYNTPATAARSVSFDKPYDDGHPYSSNKGAGHFFQWEAQMIWRLEKEGYADQLSYSTNISQHRSGAELLQHKALLCVGHDEYWSLEERNNVEAAFAAGTSIAYFTAGLTWTTRFEPSTAGVPNRTVTCYKGAAVTEDPVRLIPARYAELTTEWRFPHVTLPGNDEVKLMGVHFVYGKPKDGYSWVVYEDTSPVFAGTGLHRGDEAVTWVVRYEVDCVVSGYPIPAPGLPPLAVHQMAVNHPGGILLAHSPFTYVDGVTLRWSDAGDFPHINGNGSRTISVGCIEWARALDDYGANDVEVIAGYTPVGPQPPPQINAWKITKNILEILKAA